MKKKQLKNVFLTIMGILSLCMIVVTITTIQYNLITGISRLISLTFVALYGFFLYKKPHNNFLKFAMLLYAIADIFNAAMYLSDDKSFVTNAARLFIAAGVIYCAGRLDRIEQNRIILLVIDGIGLILSITNAIIYSSSVGFLMTIRIFGTFIMLTTLIIAYFVRYEEHKEAGRSENL